MKTLSLILVCFALLLVTLSFSGKGAKITTKENTSTNANLHYPPDDGHVHDPGTENTGIMAISPNSDHSVEKYLPYINESGVPITLGDVMGNKRHAHLKYKIVQIPMTNAKGELTGETMEVAIITAVKK